MRQRWIFPIFNGLVCALMGGLVGYYTFAIPAGVLIGGSAGLLVSLPIEWGLDRLGLKHWLYQRRVLLTVLVELPLVVFIAGPYAFVIADTRPDSHPVCCETPLDYGAQSYEPAPGDRAWCAPASGAGGSSRTSPGSWRSW